MIQNYLNSNSQRFASKWFILTIDVIVSCVAFLIAYCIRFNLSFNFDVSQLKYQIPLILIISVISFLFTGSYKGVIRHTGIRDVYNIFNAVCLSSILVISTILINKELNFVDNLTIPISIIIIYSLLSFIQLIAARYVFKSLYNNFTNRNFKTSKNIMIYGAGDAGILTYNAITNHTKSKVRVLGYIDDDIQKAGKNINGIKVFSKDSLDKNFISRIGLDEIIFSIQNIEPKKLKNLVESFVELDVKVKIVPPVEDWINGELKASQIKQVQIEDLLNRAPISIKNSKISTELTDKIIMVTGGAGSIGSEIVRQICSYPYKSLIVIDQAESALYDLQQELKRNGFHNFIPIVGDVRDKNRLNAIFEEHKPNIVFHAAAYKHVPLMEYNSYEAIKVNIAGTKTVADLSLVHNVDKFVFVSTDKAVNPTNVMGASKRIAEMYISCMQQENKTKFIITRFGNVLGSNGSVIPLFRKQIENGGPLTLTHKDITRYFMTIPEASQLVLEAGAMGKGGEIFIFDMGESVKIFDLAKNMIKLSGLQYPEDIDIKITGLRPGEKLYEELLANGENTLPTYHKKIKISKISDLEYSLVRSKIDELCITNMFFNGNTVKLMKFIVPEYVSKNSDLCEFDDNNSDSEKEQIKLKVVES